MKPRPTISLLESLPGDISKNIIIDFLGVGSLINLVRTSHRFHTLFQHDVNYILARTLFKKLLNHVARGEQDEAESLLKLFPDLLTCKGTVQYRGRYKFVNRTAWQIALANEDKAMYRMMEKYFTKLPNGDEEKRNQFNELFPDGVIINSGYHYETVQLALQKLFDAIVADHLINENNLDQMDEATKIALQTFYNLITPKPEDKFTTGLFFDLQLFLDVLNIYDKNFDTFKGKGWDKPVFICVRVLGYLLRLFPTGYLRPICQGFNNVVIEKNKERLDGSGCKLRVGGHNILPLDSDPNYRLGTHYVIDMWGRRVDGSARINVLHEWVVVGGSRLKNYVEQEREVLMSLGRAVIPRVAC